MTKITLGNTFTDVRGGGYGGSAWIALVTGLDDKFGLKRAFCVRDRSGLSRSGASGSISFAVTRPGIYEFRGFCVGSTARNWEWSGFIELLEGAEPREMTRAEVMERLVADQLRADQARDATREIQ